ncbi:MULTISPECIES: ABC transporter ATP-binding protein [Halocynthiibacter]|uniref:ATP-binding cassette domain-containing protein n=1 Tax=Halocynthiibacter halioticoli TaxID=2986804 RepID=A0AAE3IWI2_9RHOB|nr:MULTISPECIES: ATP-binding cassette domain-containing protein [Halocynthiibacter]MCV6823435.1 ATP-binding cassette domain-containing protein [Halocynthiibacter halioticoli]MCW4056436.1 ATP-binding cassette domain-containing protein [Halocynthiibacter sp. SDUM655004]
MTTPPAIHFTGKVQFGGKPLFGPVDITCPAGQWTSILGPSGVGKTTLLRLLLGLETGAQHDGKISASDGEPLAGRIAYMAQSDLLFPWLSLLENVVTGARLRSETPDLDRAHEVIAQVGLAGHEHKKPRALSGGMRQRAALARTLMENRPIVMLDEPLSALDACTRAEMQELLDHALCGKTVIMVTHDPAEACRLSNQIIVMSRGGAELWADTASSDLLMTHMRGLAA